ncbi:MAG: DUF11 domain-containing protein [Oscillospiraceae bacterium]|nr:DUF11 domain-containing protein [Oscillospiraceae bacterium]
MKSRRPLAILLCIIMLFSSVLSAVSGVLAVSNSGEYGIMPIADYNWVGAWELQKNGIRVGEQVNLYNASTWNANRIQDAYVRTDKVDFSTTTKEDVAADLIENHTVKIDSNSGYNYSITAAAYNPGLSIEDELWIFTLTIDNRGDSIQWNGQGKLIFNVGVPSSNAGDTFTEATNWRLVSVSGGSDTDEAGWTGTIVTLSNKITEEEVLTYGDVIKESYKIQVSLNGPTTLSDIIDVALDEASTTSSKARYIITAKDTFYWRGSSNLLTFYVDVMIASDEEPTGETIENCTDWWLESTNGEENSDKANWYGKTVTIPVKITEAEAESFADTIKSGYKLQITVNGSDQLFDIEDVIFDTAGSTLLKAKYKIISSKIFYWAGSSDRLEFNAYVEIINENEPQGVTNWRLSAADNSWSVEAGNLSSTVIFRERAADNEALAETVQKIKSSYRIDVQTDYGIYESYSISSVEKARESDISVTYKLTPDTDAGLNWRDSGNAVEFYVVIYTGNEPLNYDVKAWRLALKGNNGNIGTLYDNNSAIKLPDRIYADELDEFTDSFFERYEVQIQYYEGGPFEVIDAVGLRYISGSAYNFTIETRDNYYWEWDNGNRNSWAKLTLSVTAADRDAPSEKYNNSDEWQVIGYYQIRDVGLAIILNNIDYKDVKGNEEAFAESLKELYSAITVKDTANAWHSSAILDIVYSEAKSKEFSSKIRTVAAYQIIVFDEFTENGKLLEFYIAITADADFGDLSTITVPSKEPQGLTMNLFDYWGVTDDSRDEKGNPWFAVIKDNELGSNEEKYNGGINTGHLIKFFYNSPTNGAGFSPSEIGAYGVWNHSTTNERPNITGIAENLLYGGYPKLQLNKSFGSDIWTDFTRSTLSNLRESSDEQKASRTESLSYLFDPKTDHAGKASFKNVSGLLQLNDQGYYYYDSKLNFAQFDKLTNEFLLFNTWGVIPAGTSPHGQFFPFNKAEEVFSDVSSTADKNGQRKLTQFTKDEVNSRSDVMNHHFGFTMKIDFQQPVNGQVNHRIESVAEDMVFKFAGDDDCWIFVDGVLVLDLGGVHSGVYGEINFATGEVHTGLMDYQIGSGVKMSGNAWTTTTLKALFESAGVANDDDIAWGTGSYANTFAFDTLHTIQLFYMERGHWDSNFAMYFNLQPRVPHKIYKVDEDGTPLEGAVFALYAAEPKKGVFKQGETYHTADEFEKVNPFYNIKNPNDPSNPRLPANGEPQALTEDFFTTDETGYAVLNGIDFAARASSEGKFYYILEEIAPPDGARKLLTPIVLEYGYPDPDIKEEDKPYKGVFTVLNQYETGAYASFSAIIEDNGEKMFYATTTVGKDKEGNIIFDIEGTKAEIQSPHQESALLFAVPMIYTDIGEGMNWYPIYGSNTAGYRIVDIYQPDEYFDHDDYESSNEDGSDLQKSYRWALRHNLLAAAMRQVSDEIGPDWYFKYETIMTADGQEAYSRFIADLNNLPGDASRYLVNNRNVSEYDVDGVDLRLIGVLVDAEAITALLGKDPNNKNDVNEVKRMSDEEKYLALQSHLASLNFEAYWDKNYETNNGRIREWLDVAYVQNGAENTSRDRGVNLADINTFTRYYGSVFYIPNERRELRVLKEDVEGNPIPDAKFGLFESFDSAVEMKNPVATGITDENGLLIFSIEPDHNEYDDVIPGYATVNWNMIATDSLFWVREISPPDGFAINEAIVQVYVGDLTIYANASAYRPQKNNGVYVKEDGSYVPELIDAGVLAERNAENLITGENGLNTDGVSVLASVGKLFQSMEKFADTLLNSTLLDIDAYNYLFVAKKLDDFRAPEKYIDRWVNLSENSPISMHFWDQALQYASSEYSDNHKLPEGYTFSTTENGYLWMRPQQSAEDTFRKNHGREEAVYNSRRDVLLLKNGDPVDISMVFSPVNVIVIRDEYSTPHMMIEKEQSRNDSDPTKDRLTVYGGDTVTYYLTVTSDGSDTAADVVVTDTVPEGLELIKDSISNNGTVDENNTITWRLGDIEVGNSVTVSFMVKVPFVEEDTIWINIGHLTFSNNPDGPDDEIPSNEVIIEEKVNGGFGSLSITKLTTDKSNPIPFTFKVTLTLPEGETPSGSYFYTGAEEGTLEFTKKDGENLYTCEIEIHLTHGQTITFENLPVNTGFTVEETGLNGFELAQIDVEPSLSSQDIQIGLKKISGVIENEEEFEVTFVNSQLVSLPDSGSTKYFRICLASSSVFISSVGMYFALKRKKII